MPRARAAFILSAGARRRLDGLPGSHGLSLAIVVQAVLRALLTYSYNMTTARLTQGEIVPDLRESSTRDSAVELPVFRRARFQFDF